ncbi:MAG: hypothetical protein ACE5R6_04030 [Candidatus Heimdallarchaeota archaeon]
MEKTSNLMNIILIGLVSAVTGILLWYQDYAETMTALAWISVVCMTIWGVIYGYKRVSFINLITLAVIAMLVGYLTELIGTQEGLWSFGTHNPPLYIIPSWILLALTMLIMTELWYKAKFGLIILPSKYDQYLGILTPVLLLVFLIGTLGEYRTHTGPLFFAYYIILTSLNAVYYFSTPDTKKLLLAVVAAWLVSAATEFIGVSSQLWSFTYQFPVWIIISCWSLEWLAILAAINALQKILPKK